jgi:hypothetical protein
MSAGSLGWIVLVAGLFPAASSAELLHDPFARPFQAGAAPAINADTSLNPSLLAVMIAGQKSMVNLNGTIIGIGEEKDGFRLIKVEDHKAIFEKSKKRIVLEMEMPSLKPGNERGSQ